MPAGNAFDHAEKGLLDEVFKIRVRAGKPPEQAGDLGLVKQDEFLHGRAIPRPGAQGQVGAGFGGRMAASRRRAGLTRPGGGIVRSVQQGARWRSGGHESATVSRGGGQPAGGGSTVRVTVRSLSRFRRSDPCG